ncbi:NUDIX domain-containing protein [Ammoniphilus sp. 3BR4]|uniref:NUDIX hydrolase n=1 Tax=Ammoniphilus sp. 3BR4 TaxID=3158265 RepID=UPI003465EFAF
MTEYLDRLNEEMKLIGAATRNEVHQKGYWHQTFHCWVVLEEGEDRFVLFQKRHPAKETFPNKLDISAAGHLLQGETVEDGVRELEEELGIQVDYAELIFLGTYKGSYVTDAYKDREFNHIHLLKTNRKLTEFSIQQAELKGLYKVKLESFQSFLKGSQSTVEAIGFEYDDSGEKVERLLLAERRDFAAQGDGYYTFVFDAIEKAK